MKTATSAKTTLFNYGNNKDGIGFNFFHMENTNPKAETKSIIIDAGSQFPSNDLKNISNLILDISPRLKNADAIFLTHGHMDHIATLAHMIRLGHKCPPVYGTVYTLANFESMLSKLGVQSHDHPKVNIIGANRHQTHSKTLIGDFEISAYPSSHSIPGALALFARIKKEQYGEKDVNLFFSGDGRLNPAHVGYETNLDALRERFEKGIDFMLLDSTSTGTKEMPVTEAEITQEMVRLLQDNHGKKIIMSMISNNIPRMQSLMIAAGLAGYKNVDIKGWSAIQAWKNSQLSGQHDTMFDVEKNINETLQKLGSSNSVKVFTNKEGENNPYDTLTITTGVNGEEHAGLDRAANEEHPDIIIDSNTLVILSQRVIPTPGNQEIRDHLVKRIKDLGGSVIETLHASGHSSEPETERFINAVTKNISRNSFIGMPIHGNEKHLAATAELFNKMGIESFDMKSGDTVLLDPENPKIIGHENLDIIAIKSEYLAKKETEDTYINTKFIDGKLAVDYDDIICVKQSTMQAYHPSDTLATFESGAKAKMVRDGNIAMRRSEEKAKEQALQAANNKRTMSVSYSEIKMEISKASAELKKAEKKEAHAKKEARKANNIKTTKIDRLSKEVIKIQSELAQAKTNTDTTAENINNISKRLEDATLKLNEAKTMIVPAIEKLHQATQEKQEIESKLEDLKVGKKKIPNIKNNDEKVVLAPGVIPQQIAAQARRQEAARAEQEEKTLRHKAEQDRIAKRVAKKEAAQNKHQEEIQKENERKQAEQNAREKAKHERAREHSVKMAQEAVSIAIENKKEADLELSNIAEEQEKLRVEAQKASAEEIVKINESIALLEEVYKIAEKEAAEANNIMLMCAKKSMQIGKASNEAKKQQYINIAVETINSKILEKAKQ